MNLLHITLPKSGKVQIQWQRKDTAVPETYLRRAAFKDPLDIDAHEELRWYLEEYLTFPYGAERNRAQTVEEKMALWGESLFEQVFVSAKKGPGSHGFYQEAVRAGLGSCELCITSADPAFVNVPWELLYDPAPGRGYLAPSLAGLYRFLPGRAVMAEQETPAAPFRMLLVISRPFGKKDIPLGTVARPMLEALRPIRPDIELEILRPPTFSTFERLLNDNPGRYHLVHFDGHGSFSPSAGNSADKYGSDSGYLVFETQGGKPHDVSAQELGQVLNAAGVAIFVLNALPVSWEIDSQVSHMLKAQLD